MSTYDLSHHHLSHHQRAMLALLPLVGMALALLFGATWLVRPAYAATAAGFACPTNGDGPEDTLGLYIVLINAEPTVDTLVITVTPGTECIFTLVTPAEKGP